MFTKRTLLALCISVSLVSSLEALADVKQHNYVDPDDKRFTLSSKDVGVDIQAVINCGSAYGNNKECETAPTNTTNAGYGQNSNVVSGSNDARSLNKGNELNVPASTQKKMGYSSIDQTTNTNYGKTRDIAAQQELLSETYGSTSKTLSADQLKGIGINSVDSTGVNTKDTSTNLTGTYNTNKLSNAQGEALRYKCLEPNPNRPAGSRPTDDSYYLYNDVQCLSVRTVALSNDNAATSGFTKSDPLRDFVAKSATTNKDTNNKVINVNTTASNATTANNQSYACELTPMREEYSNSTCQSQGVGRQQICNQKLTIECGANVKGDRDLPECVSGLVKGSFKLAPNSTRSAASFKVTDTNFSMAESWKDKGSTTDWYFTFMVNNPDKVKMTLTFAHIDNRLEFKLNNLDVYSGQTGKNASVYPNVDMSPKIRLGLNTFHVRLINWDGPAAAHFNVAIDPSSYTACQCKESWVKTCSIQNVELQ
ncbi:hypothetical protein HCY52_07960 [Acinetobacter radioresistens]|uniref:hypothetical protein n=1 Tax=Acinetobacter radioresistens TaxID=40216 RepID=UPI0020043C0A|nr:hypothetical protein [Acinetobacter radioresistens]MCK4083749.1 hypothetical protein [Acinetobacter radioresistens]